MVKALSITLAQALGSQLQSDKAQVEIYAYGMEILLGALIKLILLIIISLIMNILPFTMLVLAAFACFRIPGGGVHLSTYGRCLSAGLLLILGLAKISESLFLSAEELLLAVILTGIIAIITIILWIPAGTEKKVFTDPEIIKGQKVKTAFFMMIWLTAISLLMFFNLYDFVLAVVLGALAGLFFITPPGYLIMKRLDNILAEIGKEVNY